jgi:hypothetical protein
MNGQPFTVHLFEALRAYRISPDPCGSFIHVFAASDAFHYSAIMKIGLAALFARLLCFGALIPSKQVSAQFR